MLVLEQWVYFIASNRSEYVKFNDAYDYIKIINTSEDGAIINTRELHNISRYQNPFTSLMNTQFVYSESQLKNARDLYRRNTDFSYILTGLWYLLNVVDASVDAHLFEFEVNDDLTF